MDVGGDDWVGSDDFIKLKKQLNMKKILVFCFTFYISTFNLFSEEQKFNIDSLRNYIENKNIIVLNNHVLLEPVQLIDSYC